MNYRPEIDGLRALAVLPVLLFHAGVPTFAGGYVGVDVFFVISGYLITGIIAPEMAEDRFSLITFYERRIRRIMPCLIAVIGFCLVAATILLLPGDFMSLSKSIIATDLFSSNILFWRESGYFNTQMDLVPLLHTWSLAVEEQFYILFPPALVLLHRLGRSMLVLIIALLAVASFLLNVWSVPEAISFAFYMAPTRAWELLTGSLLALGFLPPLRSKALREGLALLGIALIASAICFYSAHTPFPGYHALVPVLGAALVIYASQETVCGRTLSLGPVVFIGLISYSLYLWHWPIMVFARYYLLDEFSGWNVVAVLLLSLCVAILSWRYIEKPFRRKGVVKRRLLFAAAPAAMLLLTAAGWAGLASKGWASRVPADVAYLESFKHDSSPRRVDCHRFENSAVALSQSCVFGAPVAPKFAIWGDSHAVELAFALGEVAEQHQQSLMQVSYSSCPPVLRSGSPGCRRHNDAALRYLSDHPTIRTVFLIAFYDNDKDNRPSNYAEGLRTAVSKLSDAGKYVVLIYPIPRAMTDVPSALARYAWNGIGTDMVGSKKSEYLQRNVEILHVLDTLTVVRNVARLLPHEDLCQEDICSVLLAGKPLYFDNHHLSLSGARHLAPLFEHFFGADDRSADLWERLH
jgi:peptidoglycan/LPS O-acetylase OafA/YrhL